MGQSGSNGKVETKAAPVKRGGGKPVATLGAEGAEVQTEVVEAPKEAAPLAVVKTSKPQKKAAPKPAPAKAKAAPTKKAPPPKAKAAATPPAPAPKAPSPTSNGAMPHVSGGIVEVASGPMLDTYLQIDCPCEVCDRPMLAGARIWGRMAMLSNGSRAFQARCFGHGGELNNPQPVVEVSPEESAARAEMVAAQQAAEAAARAEAEARAEWTLIMEEAGEIGDHIQAAVATMPPPENVLRRMSALLMALAHATAHTGVQLGWEIQDVADHVAATMAEMHHQIAQSQQQQGPGAEDAPRA